MALGSGHTGSGEVDPTERERGPVRWRMLAGERILTLVERAPVQEVAVAGSYAPTIQSSRRYV